MQNSYVAKKWERNPSNFETGHTVCPGSSLWKFIFLSSKCQLPIKVYLEKLTSLIHRKIELFMKMSSQKREQPYRVIHKLPPGDSPYVRAKHLQVFTHTYIHTSHGIHICMHACSIMLLSQLSLLLFFIFSLLGNEFISVDRFYGVRLTQWSGPLDTCISKVAFFCFFDRERLCA